MLQATFLVSVLTILLEDIHKSKSDFQLSKFQQTLNVNY